MASILWMPEEAVRIDNWHKLSMGLRIAALAGFVGLIIYLSIVYSPQVAELFARRQELKQHIEARGLAGILIFIFFEVFQVVIAAVPGEIVQITGGYIYGTFWGSIYLIIGVTIGSALNFFLARWLGYEIVKKIVPKKRLAQLYNLVRGPRSDAVMFLLFLIPGLPKDVLTYVAGLTPVPAGRFLLLSVAGRLPALVGSSFIGASFQQENTATAVAVLAAAGVLALLGVVCKDRIIALLRK